MNGHEDRRLAVHLAEQAHAVQVVRVGLARETHSMEDSGFQRRIKELRPIGNLNLVDGPAIGGEREIIVLRELDLQVRSQRESGSVRHVNPRELRCQIILVQLP